MNRAKAYLNRFVKRKQQQILDTYHTINLKDIRPITSKLMEHSETIVINNSKRAMIKQSRDTDIQRENRLLLQKLSSVMSKKGTYSVSKTKSTRTKANKSLNDIYRKNQLNSIELENKRLLERLQNKKPTMNTDKLNKDWIDNKSVIKRMANYEFNLTSMKPANGKSKGMTSQRFIRSDYQKYKTSRYKNFNGHRMLIKVEFIENVLKIIGDSQEKKQLKVIQIPKQQGIQFLEKDCKGRIDILMSKLRYDDATQTMYLINQDGQEEDAEFLECNPENQKISNKKMKETEKGEKRFNRFALTQRPQKFAQQSQRPNKLDVIPTNKNEKTFELNRKQQEDSIQISNINHQRKVQTKQPQEKVTEKQLSVKLINAQQEKYDEQKFQQSYQNKNNDKKQEIVIEPEANEDYDEQFEPNSEVKILQDSKIIVNNTIQ